MKSADAEIIFAALLIDENKHNTKSKKRPANTQHVIAEYL